ncbi:MAG: hypothetical protein CL916_04245 [Deltaproteobacteria bacterium]|nr:hypothetical protein [Deltaproteobacteria bacterium]
MILALFLSIAAFADTQIWMKVGYRKKLIPKTHIKFTQHLRLEENGTAIESIIPELEFIWKGIPWFDVAPGYRLFWRRTKNDTLELAQRGHLDLQKDWSLNKKIDAGYRMRLQARQELDETEVRYGMRHKVAWEYDAPKGWRPNGFVEYYLTPDARDKFQVGVGSKYKVNKRNRVSLRFVWERFIVTKPDNFIVMMGYEYRQRKKKKS